MSIYLYTITDVTPAAANLPQGIGGGEVEVLAHRELVALVSELAQLPSPVRPIHLERHDAVTRVALAAGACVPLRFGTLLSSRSACRELLDERADQWIRVMNRLRGRVELSVKVIVPAATTPRSLPQPGGMDSPGMTYLLQRRAELQAAQATGVAVEQLADALRQGLRSVAEAIVVQVRGRLLSVAILLDTERFDAAVAQVRELVSGQPGPWAISRPWPPYSFVDDGTGVHDVKD